jgi:hypothetical protein
MTFLTKAGLALLLTLCLVVLLTGFNIGDVLTDAEGVMLTLLWALGCVLFVGGDGKGDRYE